MGLENGPNVGIVLRTNFLCWAGSGNEGRPKGWEMTVGGNPTLVHGELRVGIRKLRKESLLQCWEKRKGF